MPGVYVASYYVGGLTKNEAQDLLNNNVSVPEKIKVLIAGNESEISLSNLEFRYNFEQSLNNAFDIRREKDLKSQISVIFPYSRVFIAPSYSLNKEKLNQEILRIGDFLSQKASLPYLYIKNGEVILENGKPGYEVNIDDLNKKLDQNLSTFNFSPIEITTTKVDPTLDEKAASRFIERGKKFLGKTLTVVQGDTTISFDDEKILPLLDSVKTYNQKGIEQLTTEIASQVDRNPQDSVFIFDENKVKEFKPSKEGVAVNKNELTNKIISYLSDFEVNGDESNVEVPVDTTQPKITTDSINNLGIKELLGRGSSKFTGSITSRVHNIGLSSSKFNGILIPPGEVFSFNNTLGDVSKYTGYKQAYIIQNGQTILGDGGGVCQVSTTFFRAALAAGLPITERRAHSYRVSYYEQGSPVGLDATVFSPTTDLKIKNDTPGHLLIQTIFDASQKTLVFEIYGTSDGRVATIGKSVITSSTPPPPDLYIDDPTLPTGAVKQIDFKAWGAKVNFSYKVERSREVLIDKVFYSNYQPWQAKFLRGTGNI